MYRSTISLALACALTLGACSSDSDDRPVDPSRLSLQIVSGDRQTAPVRPAGGSSASLSPEFAPAQALPPNLLPEPLVARIVVDGKPVTSRSTPSDPLGPSLATLPSDVVVTYRVIQPNDDRRDCGASFIDAAKPDDEGYVTTYWERGTLAGHPCRMEVRLVVDGAPRVDTVFVAEFEPGPPVFLGSDIVYRAVAGEPLDLSKPLRGFHAHDAYQNRVPDSLVVTWTSEWVITGPKARAGDNCDNLAVAARGSGWIVPVAPAASAEPYCLEIFVEGATTGLRNLWVHHE